MYDTVIEVIDENSHEVLATLRHDLMLSPVCGSGLVALVSETEVGDTRMQILRPVSYDRLGETSPGRPGAPTDAA